MSNLEFNKTVDLHEVKTYFHHFLFFNLAIIQPNKLTILKCTFFLNLGIQKRQYQQCVDPIFIHYKNS